MTPSANNTRTNTYLAIGIIVVGLTGFFQATNTIRTYIKGETGTDIRRQVEPTQTADITKIQTDISAIKAGTPQSSDITQIQTDISAIKTAIDTIKKDVAELRQWQIEELRSIADLQARVTNLERKPPK